MESRSLSKVLTEARSELAALAKDFDLSSPSLDTFFDLTLELISVLDVLSRNGGLTDTSETRKAVTSLVSDLSRARVLLTTESTGSKSGTGKMEELKRDMGRSLGLVELTGVDLAEEVKERIGALRREMTSPSSSPGLSSPPESDEFGTGSAEIEEVEDDEVVGVGAQDVLLQVRNCGGGGDEDENLLLALRALNDFIVEEIVNNEWIEEECVVEILSNRLSLANSNNVRSAIINILQNVVAQHPDHKERMVDVGVLTMLVKSLAREAAERREAVGLLLTLSQVPAARKRIGKIQGCIAMLVSMLNGDDQVSLEHSSNLLDALSSNSQNALHMAEAGYFKPLPTLSAGSNMSKILMATALSRIKLTDQNRAALGQDGAIEPLAKMFKTGKMEAKLSSLNALYNLSGLPENVRKLISSGIVPQILQLLFSVTSVLMTLREPAAAILAKIAHSKSILVNHDITQQMLSLLSLSSPSIKHHLLRALNSICDHSRASRVRRKMMASGAFQLLLPFLSEPKGDVRAAAANLLYTLSNYFPAAMIEELEETSLAKIVEIMSSSGSEEEKAAVVGILSNVPVSDKRMTDALLRANAVPILLSLLDDSIKSSTPVKHWVSESISGILIRFTVPSDKYLQRICGQYEVMPLLVKVISNESSSIIAKCRAATSLAQLSQSSLSLRKQRKWKWACAPPSADSFCEVHAGFCHAKTTFCLVKAEAVTPLIQILQGEERAADKAVLSAISTLLVDEIWENGSNFLAGCSNCLQAIVKVLESGPVKVQEKCLWILERIFRVEGHRNQFGEAAEGILAVLAQNGELRLKPAAAEILAHLELLQATVIGPKSRS